MAVILALAVLLLVASDGLITYKVLSKYGVEVELNVIIRRLADAVGLAVSIGIGIAIPTLLWLAVAYTLHAPLILALLVAARAGFLVKQIETHRP